MPDYRGTVFIYQIDIDFKERTITFVPEVVLEDCVKPPTHILYHYWQHFKSREPKESIDSLAQSLSESWTRELFG